MREREWDERVWRECTVDVIWAGRGGAGGASCGGGATPASSGPPVTVNHLPLVWYWVLVYWAQIYCLVKGLVYGAQVYCLVMRDICYLGKGISLRVAGLLDGEGGLVYRGQVYWMVKGISSQGAGLLVDEGN